jgi:hypothetical protein
MKAAFFDLCAFAGLVSIAYAAWLVHPALAFLVGGLELLAIGVLAATVEKLNKKDKQR